MRVLITGADGFIGSHLVERCLKEGYEVSAFVFYNSFSTWGWLDSLDQRLLEHVEICMGDIRDSFKVENTVKGCDVIFHLAALTGIPYSYESANSYVDTNIQGTLNVLQAGLKHEVQRIIHTSTSEVYGTALYVPIDEKHSLQGQSPYSASKIAADQMALSYYRSFDLPVNVIRPFNTYGPRQSARAIIPTVISQILSGKEEIKLGSLSPTRDLSFVSDTVNGFIMAASAKTDFGHEINLGAGFEISMGELADTIIRLMGVGTQVVKDIERLRPFRSEVERLLSDNRKAKKLLNWEPIYKGKKGLEKGLKETIDWFSNKENQRIYKSNRYII